MALLKGTDNNHLKYRCTPEKNVFYFLININLLAEWEHKALSNFEVHYNPSILIPKFSSSKPAESMWN